RFFTGTVIRLVNKLTEFVNLYLALITEHLINSVTNPFGSPTEVNLEYLPDVHSRRNTQWVKHHIHRGAIGHMRHILYRYDIGYHTFVTVTTRHLVPRCQATLDR